MRHLASYSFQSVPGDSPAAIQPADVHGHVDKWLLSKGTLSAGGNELTYHRDGRLAALNQATIESSQGKIIEKTLVEPMAGGSFRTAVSVAESPELIAVSVILAAGSQNLSPLSLDVHCPRLVRDLLAPPSPWSYGASGVTSSPVDFDGVSGGDDFITLAWYNNRSVPVVAISDEYGAVLHPGIVEALAADLAGLAIVARLDADASWRITGRKDKIWSCYGGAIRLYWPGLDDTAAPYNHPLWTPSRLLARVADTETAAGRIRSQLRRRILGQSAFAVSQPPIFVQIRRAARQEELDALRSRATPDTDYELLAEDYFNEVVRRDALLEERDGEIVDLKAQVRNLQLALRWKDETPEAVEPDEDTPPSTVEEAVLAAVDQFGDTLVFGSSVNQGESMQTVASDAGPPDKILNYLRALAEYTEAKRTGNLGTTAIKWLEDKGVTASGESDSNRNSPKERQARTWDDGFGERRLFDLHLKPSNATSPDRCVRIFFEYDEQIRKTIVGWVGAHR